MKPNDSGLSGDTFLLRALIDPGWWKLENGVPRVTSFAFTSGDEPSCYIDTPERRKIMAEQYPNTPFGRFRVSSARQFGLNICIDPDAEGSTEHVVLIPSDLDQGRNVRQKACRSLARVSSFLSPEDFLAGREGVLAAGQL